MVSHPCGRIDPLAGLRFNAADHPNRYPSPDQHTCPGSYTCPNSPSNVKAYLNTHPVTNCNLSQCR